MDEKEVLRGRITDLWNRTSRGDYLNHTGFLSPDLQSYAREILAKEKIPVKSEGKAGSFFFGGFEEADRQALFFLPAYMSTSDFEHEIRRGEGDVVCIRIQPPGRGFAEPVTHRDYLGSLMHLGITREQIGDIVLMDGAAFVFAMRDIASFICTELTRVRHNTVHVQTVPFAECRIEVRREPGRGSVSSERIDSLTALVFHLSRSQSQRLIAQEKVFSEGRVITSPSYCPKAGERISVRGYGKFKYMGTEGRTRKGKLAAVFEKYV